MTTRETANDLLLSILSKYLRENPDMRFCQALANLEIWNADCDEYYTESVDTWKAAQAAYDQVRPENRLQ